MTEEISSGTVAPPEIKDKSQEELAYNPDDYLEIIRNISYVREGLNKVFFTSKGFVACDCKSFLGEI